MNQLVGIVVLLISFIAVINALPRNRLGHSSRQENDYRRRSELYKHFRQRNYISAEKQSLSHPDSELLKQIAEHKEVERNLKRTIQDEDAGVGYSSRQEKDDQRRSQLLKHFRQRNYISAKKQYLSHPDSELLKKIAEHKEIERNLKRTIQDEDAGVGYSSHQEKGDQRRSQLPKHFRQRSYVSAKKQSLSHPDSELLKQIAEHKEFERNLKRLMEDKEEEEGEKEEKDEEKEKEEEKEENDDEKEKEEKEKEEKEKEEKEGKKEKEGEEEEHSGAAEEEEDEKEGEEEEEEEEEADEEEKEEQRKEGEVKEEKREEEKKEEEKGTKRQRPLYRSRELIPTRRDQPKLKRARTM